MTAKLPLFDIGTRFGDWEVIEQLETRAISKTGQVRFAYSRVRCICGTEKALANNYLRAGRSKGCGCRRAEAWQKCRHSHGKSRTATYKLWASIKHRLKHQRAYADVEMYEPWVNDFTAFELFIESLGPKPTAEHTLDRINPTGDYVPVNLRWADKAMQSMNRRAFVIEQLSHRTGRIPVHGKTGSEIHKLWCHIKHRLKNDRAYEGIQMYEPWRTDFAAFEAHIESLGSKPTPQHTLDRINPNGDYAPGNLRWADKTTQSENRRNNKYRNLEKNSIVNVGQRYDLLTVLEVLIERRHGVTWYVAKVQCDCGTVKTVYQKQLLAGRTKSCGCFKNKNLILGHKALEKPITVNGETLSMRAWARRQEISPQVIWTRIHRLGWDPVKAVTQSLRETEPIEVNGEKLSAAQWSERHGVPVRVIVKRLEKFGWDPERAVSQPVRGWHRKPALAENSGQLGPSA